MAFKFKLGFKKWHQSGSCTLGQQFVPAGFQGEDVVDVDCDVQVTEGLLREEEILEGIRGVLDEENENDDVEVVERSEDILT